MEFRVENVELPVWEISSWRDLAVMHIDDTSYITATGCPVCGNAETQPLSEVRTLKQRGLETHFCLNCEHIFFNRYPDEGWFTEFYKETKDDNSGVNNSLKRRIKRYLRNKPFLYDIWLKRLLARHRSAATLNAVLKEVMADASREYYVNTGLSWLAQPRVKNVLEIGCGSGETLHFFKSHGLSPVGTEASPKRVELCRAEGLNVKEVPLSDMSSVASLGPFDLITSAHVLEHIIDLNSHLSQIQELSHDSTYLYFEVPNALQENMFSRAYNPSHAHVFSLRSLTHLLAKFGFTVIRVFQDLNTHVLAIRSTSGSPNLGTKEALSTNRFAQGLSELRKNLGQRIRIRFAAMDFHREITNLDTGDEIFRYDPGFPTRELPETHLVALQGILQADSAASPDSLIFLHDGDKAPIII